MPFLKICYAAENEAPIYQEIKNNKPIKGAINKVLMETWLGVTKSKGDWHYVKTAGEDGWIHKDNCKDKKGLKVFFVDVMQGDGIVVEVGDRRILVDGGPDDNLPRFLRGWQYSYEINNQKRVHIDDVFVSHFDADHYEGLTVLINDPRFSFGTVYHNGIARFTGTKSKRPATYNTDLGKKIKIDGSDYLVTGFDDLESLKKLKDKGGLQPTFYAFAKACIAAKEQGRLKKIKFMKAGDNYRGLTVGNYKFDVQVLGPVVKDHNGTTAFKWFKDSSHTRNGHSLVLRFTYGDSSVLLGGDLNKKSEQHLMASHAPENPFEVDVAKGCHHGASDFADKFMEFLNPYATVISSGDNESYAHPRADAIGCAGKYSKAIRPLVFSTELARSINSAGKILYGMIHFRSDGKRIYMAQMKERRTGADIWDSYEVKK
jgi:beta-lactamase superfamily II metal-dependent hydrolase